MSDHISENNENARRISLSEASRRAPKILQRGDSLLLDEGAPPTLNDLADALQFALGDGRIWLNDNRMVLMQADMLGALAAQMIADNGMDHARVQSLRLGWQEGVKLAHVVKARFPQQDLTASLAAGPRLHTIEGYAKVTTRRFEFDAKQKTYHGEFIWHDSVVGTYHLRHFGVCDCPICWMQLGVPSGYTSTLLEFPVIFREIECVAQGAPRCLVVGKDVEGWGDDVPELEIFGLSRKPARRSAPWNPAKALPETSETRTPPSDDVIVGSSPAIQRTRRLLEKASPFGEPVLLLGEPGTGKSFFAKYLHSLGINQKAPFVAVNSAALGDAVAGERDELLGEGGAMARARGGTLFLNALTSLGASRQAKLASYLSEGHHREQGTRVISSSEMSLVEAVADGTFRSDLYNLLSILPIEVPPLRERRDDIPELVTHFLALHRKRHRTTVAGLSGAGFDALLRYDYPGNVRELSNLIGRGVIFADPGGFIEINHMFSALETLPEIAKTTKLHIRQRAEDRDGATGPSMIETLEIELLRTTLNETGWNVSEAARKLGLTRAKVDYRIKKFSLAPGPAGRPRQR